MSFAIRGKQTLAMRVTTGWYVGETDFFKIINIAPKPQTLNSIFEKKKGGPCSCLKSYVDLITQ